MTIYITKECSHMFVVRILQKANNLKYLKEFFVDIQKRQFIGEKPGKVYDHSKVHPSEPRHRL